MGGDAALDVNDGRPQEPCGLLWGQTSALGRCHLLSGFGATLQRFRVDLNSPLWGHRQRNMLASMLALPFRRQLGVSCKE